jgi:hypothetical protein
VTIATDDYFAGLRCWSSQILLSIFALQAATKSFIRPQKLFNESAATLATWQFAGTELFLGIDFVYLNDLLVSKAGAHARVLAWTPLHALDLGIDRDLTAKFRGFSIPLDLMPANGLVSLEERTAYLIQAKVVRSSLIDEWNLFSDIQQSLWLTIFDEESDGGIFFDGTTQIRKLFTPTSAYRADEAIVIPIHAYMRGVTRANYEDKITQWLSDSGTTARSGGIATTNDSYIEWLNGQLSSCPANTNLIPKNSIDPRAVYKFAPQPFIESGGDGSGGVSGTPDTGNADPANYEQSKALDLLDELESRGGELAAELGTSTTKNIDTLPEC